MKPIIKGEITSLFGTRKDPINPNTWKHHNGIDIAAPIGTQIHSPINAIVVDIYEHFSGGLTLILADKEQTIRLGFCHLSKVKVYVGEPVRKDEIIAFSGNTGHSTGPHLHFSLKTGGKWENKKYVNGTFVNPSPYFSYE